MQKRIIGREAGNTTTNAWLDLDSLADVEVTSEDPAHPIESGLSAWKGSGWRAGGPGEQVIRLVFKEPIRLQKVHLVFREETVARTQEFVLRSSLDRGVTYREVVRQQYTFSPSGAARELEEYYLGVGDITTLELRIVPDISGGEARASLAEFRLR